MPLSIIIDVFVALLLVVTIFYAFKLNKSLSILRRNKSQFRELTETFTEATLRAEQGVGRLHAAAQAMQKDIQKAEALRDDLRFLIERASQSADALAEDVRAHRPSPSGLARGRSGTIASLGAAAAAAASSIKQPTRSVPKAPPQSRNQAERELLRALRAAK